MKLEKYNECSKAARKLIKADLVLKNANIVNVFTESVDKGSIAIKNGMIVGIGDYEGEEEQDGVKEQPVGDNRVYDLLGRCVATEEQVKDGTWKQNLRPGIYILNGRKIRK